MKKQSPISVRISLWTWLCWGFLIFLDGGLFLLFSYGLMIIHECAHCFIAICLNCQVDRIVIYPFGCAASIDGHHHLTLIERILLYGAGPFVHVAVMMMIEVCFKCGGISVIMRDYLSSINSNYLLFNLFPVFPLDGYHLVHAIFLGMFPYRMALISSQLVSFFGVFLLYQLRPAESAVYLICLLIFFVIQCTKMVNIKKEMNQFYLIRYLNWKKRDEFCHSLDDLFVYKENWILRNGQILSEKTLLKKILKLEGK